MRRPSRTDEPRERFARPSLERCPRTALPALYSIARPGIRPPALPSGANRCRSPPSLATGREWLRADSPVDAIVASSRKADDTSSGGTRSAPSSRCYRISHWCVDRRHSPPFSRTRRGQARCRQPDLVLSCSWSQEWDHRRLKRGLEECDLAEAGASAGWVVRAALAGCGASSDRATRGRRCPKRSSGARCYWRVSG